jgi:hypothetical protein
MNPRWEADPDWQAPDDLDPQCLALCKAINTLPDVITTESCWGHGKRPYRVFLVPRHPEALLPVLYYLSNCHSGEAGWRCEVYTDCGMSHVTWMVEGPVGAFGASERIAKLIADHAASATKASMP